MGLTTISNTQKRGKSWPGNGPEKREKEESEEESIFYQKYAVGQNFFSHLVGQNFTLHQIRAHRREGGFLLA
jgi:hypothetical protein